MSLRHFVGIDLVAAVQHQGEGLALVFAPEPFPHGIPLGTLAVHVPHFLAVAGHVGQSQVARQIARDHVGRAVPAVFGRSVGREREPRPPDGRAIVLCDRNRRDLTMLEFERRNRRSLCGYEECRQKHLPILDIIQNQDRSDGGVELYMHSDQLLQHVWLRNSE